MRRAVPDDQLPVADVLTRLAGVAREQGRLDEADRLLDQVQPILSTLPSGTAYLAQLDFERARVLLARGQAAAALEALRRIRPWYERQYSAVHAGRAELVGVEGEALVRLGRLSEAEPLLLASDEVLRNGTPPESSASAKRLVDLYQAAGREDEADAYRERARPSDPG